MMQYAERNQFSADDLVGLAAAAPKGLDKDTLHGLGAILRQSLAGGTVVEAVVARFKAETPKPIGAALTARQAAHVAHRWRAGGGDRRFPARVWKRPRPTRTPKPSNLLAKHFVALHGRENKLDWLEKALGRDAGGLGRCRPTRSTAPIRRRPSARRWSWLPSFATELGQAWLEQSFTAKPERGMNILATIGALSASGLTAQPHSPDGRFKTLELLKTAVEALLKAAPARAKEWRDTLTLLGGVWLTEAEFTYQFAEGSGAGPHAPRSVRQHLLHARRHDAAVSADEPQPAQAHHRRGHAEGTPRSGLAGQGARRPAAQAGHDAVPAPSQGRRGNEGVPLHRAARRRRIRDRPASWSTSFCACGRATTIPTPPAATRTLICSCSASSAAPRASR